MSKKISVYFNAFIPPLLWAGVIFYLSSQNVLPGLAISTYDFLLKKIVHMSVYAVLYILTYRAFSLLVNPKHKQVYIWGPLLLCLIYAITDELHQSFVPNRFGTVRDIGYDILGTGLMWLKVYRYI